MKSYLRQAYVTLYVRYPTSSYKYLAKVIYARLADAAFRLLPEASEWYGVYQFHYLRRALTYLLLIHALPHRPDTHGLRTLNFLTFCGQLKHL